MCAQVIEPVHREAVVDSGGCDSPTASFGARVTGPQRFDRDEFTEPGAQCPLDISQKLLAAGHFSGHDAGRLGEVALCHESAIFESSQDCDLGCLVEDVPIPIVQQTTVTGSLE